MIKVCFILYESHKIKINNFYTPMDSEFYKNYIDKNIKIILQDEAQCTGVCRSIDGYLNVVLENAEFDSPSSDNLCLSSCLIRGTGVKHIEKMLD